MPFNFRDTMNRARRNLHDIKAEDARYTVFSTGVVVEPVRVRVHREVVLEGNADPLPSAKYVGQGIFILLDALEISNPNREDIIQLVDSEEQFTVDNAEAPDGEFIRVWVR